MPTGSISTNRIATCRTTPSGPEVDAHELARAATETARSSSSSERRRLIERIADNLAAGRIVAWMDGASEFGPRALGHRGVLAAPHSREMRDRLNRDVERREEFRPFAPVTPLEVADSLFELPPGGARLARFMSGVFPCGPTSARADSNLARQRVGPGPDRRAHDGPGLHALLQAYRRPGVPVFLDAWLTSRANHGEWHARGCSTFRR